MAALSPGALRVLSISQLLALKDKAAARLLEGADTISISASGRQRSRAVSISPQDLLDAVSTELRVRDPATYGVKLTTTFPQFA